MEFLLRFLANCSCSIEDVKNVCEKIGVNITNSDGSYKKIDEVFKDLLDAYQRLKR